MAHTTDINKANMDELQRALQVNKECAQVILQKREELGGFSSWEEIKQVTGASDDIIERLKDSGFEVINFSTPTPPSTATPPKRYP